MAKRNTSIPKKEMFLKHSDLYSLSPPKTCSCPTHAVVVRAGRLQWKGKTLSELVLTQFYTCVS